MEKATSPVDDPHPGGGSSHSTTTTTTTDRPDATNQQHENNNPLIDLTFDQTTPLENNPNRPAHTEESISTETNHEDVPVLPPRPKRARDVLFEEEEETFGTANPPPPLERPPKIKYARRLPVDEQWVDWDVVAQARWGQDLLTRFLPVREMDQLIGWATHLASPHGAVTLTRTTLPSSSASSSSPPPVPPPPPSSVATASSSSQSPPPSRPHSRNVLLGLPNIPLPPSLLTWMHLAASEKAYLDSSKVFYALDISALVTLGMVLEEMVTANLWTLAEQHVHRCRQIEAVTNSQQSTWMDWTLPPEEAMWKLVHAPPPTEPGPSTTELPTADAAATVDPEDTPLLTSFPWATSGRGLLTLRPTTHTVVSGAEGTSRFNLLSAQGRIDHQLIQWCRAVHLEPSLVLENWDLFQYLLPGRPSSSIAAMNRPRM